MYWNAFSTDQAGLGLTAELTTFAGGNGDTIRAWIARPIGEGPHPGIVVLHHMPGFDEFTFEFCSRLAFHGFIVIAPNLYDHYGQGQPGDVAAAVRADGGVSDESVIGDGAAALEWLKSQPDFNGRAGVTGPCSGGRHALLVATVVPGFAAIADLWGGGAVPGKENDKRPVAPGLDHRPARGPAAGHLRQRGPEPDPRRRRSARGRAQEARQAVRVPSLGRRPATASSTTTGRCTPRSRRWKPGRRSLASSTRPSAPSQEAFPCAPTSSTPRR